MGGTVAVRSSRRPGTIVDLEIEFSGEVRRLEFRRRDGEVEVYSGGEREYGYWWNTIYYACYDLGMSEHAANEVIGLVEQIIETRH